MESTTSIAFKLELLVGDLEWQRILRYFGRTRYRLRTSGIILTHCIWHTEKTPSLILYPPTKGHGFSCYGCGRGGWRYSFILTAALLLEELGETAQPFAGRYDDRKTIERYALLDQARKTYFEARIPNGYTWPTGRKGYRRARRKLIALIDAIRAAERG